MSWGLVSTLGDASAAQAEQITTARQHRELVARPHRLTRGRGSERHRLQRLAVERVEHEQEPGAGAQHREALVDVHARGRPGRKARAVLDAAITRPQAPSEAVGASGDEHALAAALGKAE